MSGLRGYVAADRAILRIGGAEARDWLQNLVTNDVSQMGPETAVYAALLTPQGKYQADFFLFEDADAILLDVAAPLAPALTKRLTLYKVRRKVTLQDASDQFGVALVWGEGPPPAPPGARVAADPRAATLGWRLYAADPAAALAAVGADDATSADYDALRVAAAVPESGVELIPEDSFILEYGFDRLRGVDFRKGCYVGQEVTARMRHKTELRKGLVRVALDGPAAAGAQVTTPDGKPAGVLHTVAGCEALAHLRFDRAEGAMVGGTRLRRIE